MWRMWTRDFEEAGENLQSELPVFNILFCFHEQICGMGGDGYLALVLVFSGLRGIGADYYYYYS